MSLLIMQMSGAHLHVDPYGDNASVHGIHLHEADHHSHGHSGETDIVVFEELNSNWLKISVCILVYATLIIALSWSGQTFSLFSFERSTPSRRSRWRPPLRAPPANP